MGEEKTVDFRYNTGAARVPWEAVGEKPKQAEILDIIEFLCPPKKDSKSQYSKQLENVRKELLKLREHSNYATKLAVGGNVKKVEEQACKILGAKHATFLTNCTAGFEIANKFAGVGPGDEVIVPAITFISTMLYPLLMGAKVVLADVDKRTINLDPEDVKRKITDKTKVIIPVHIGGYPVDMDPIMEAAEKNDIMVIEDAAHAFSGQYKGQMLGTIGDFGSYSFHEVKNITAFGEGGILVTNSSYGKQFDMARFVGMDSSEPIDKWLYNVKALQGKKGYAVPGNYSTTEIQALCLLRQFKRLDKIIAERREAAEYLSKRFSSVEEIIPQMLDSEHVKATYHLYLLQIDPDKTGADIQDLKKKLSEKGVTQIAHYAPLYKFDILKQLGYDVQAIQESCPVAEEVFQRCFTHLPVYGLTKEQLKYMADAVIESVQELKKGK